MTESLIKPFSLMGTYRDGVEFAFVNALKSEVLKDADDFQSALVRERIQAGADAQ